MRIPSQRAAVLQGAAVIAFLSGCAGGGSQASPVTGPVAASSQAVRIAQSNVAPAHRIGFVNVAGINAPGGNQVIVSDEGSNSVSVYNATGKLNALLTAGLNQPNGIATDAAQNLYVANTQDFDVLVYTKPYTSVGLTLADSGLYPTGVAVSGTGLVAVMNIVANPYGPGGERFYARGSASACATVSDANWHGMFYGAFDASGNLFFDGDDPDGNPLVGEITGGCAATSVTTLHVKNTLYNPEGVGVVNGKVLILDQREDDESISPVIFTYAPPVNGSLGSPLTKTKLSAGIEMTTFAMVKGDQDLWIAHSDVAAGRIEYSYPNGRFVKSFNESGLVTAIGIAVNPTAGP